jgi:Domain of unknown function (DUF4388)
MRNEIILFVFPFHEVLERLCTALFDEGYRSITAENPAEARVRMAALPYMNPDIVITHAELAPPMRRLMSEWTSERVSYVLLTDDDPQTHWHVITEEDVVGHVAPPYNNEALIQCLSVASFAAQRGSFPTISPNILLRTLSDEQKTGTVVFTRGAECVTVRFRDGRMVSATGVPGTTTEVLSYLLTWSDGRFRVALEPVSDVDDVNESTDRLILAGVRAVGSGNRRA